MLYGMLNAVPELGWELYVALGIIFALLVLTVPIWVSIGMGTLFLLYMTDVLPLALMGEAVFDGIDSFSLIAVPLFILTGDVLVRSGLSEKLLNVAEALTRGLLAGFGTATILGCGFFACISGSDAAGAAAVGRMTYDRLVRQGYPKDYASALIASGACTGILIPPSIAYIILGLVFGLSSSTLFLAAAIPGVMIMMSVMITNLFLNHRRGYEYSTEKFSLTYLLRTLYDSRDALSIPVIILGGIYTGIFTPTEAAAVAVFVGLMIGVYQKKITIDDFPKMLMSSAQVNGVILPIVAISLPLAQTLASLDVPQFLVQEVTTLTDNRNLLILLMIAILIVAGCVIETTPNILILGPILLPIAQSIGMDEIHFSIFMVTTLGVGFITPPLGLNLFVLSGITGRPVLGISKQAIPLMLGMLVVVLMIAYIPTLSLFFL